MFEDLKARAGRHAEALARARGDELAARLGELLPRGVAVERVEGGVMLSGRGLKRRLVLDASLRWTVAGLIR